MKNNPKRWLAIPCVLAMAALILDGKTALQGCREGVELCLQTVIPSIFPFLLLSSVLVGLLEAFSSRSYNTTGVLAFLLGLLGGYPTGARCIDQWVSSGRLSPKHGRQLLAYCSNAGPAFLFGIGIQILPSTKYCWIVWGIHIFSAATVAFLMPRADHFAKPSGSAHPIRTDGIMKQALVHMASICGWVVIMRMILLLLRRWIFWMLPQTIAILFSGAIELTNGCILLPQMESLGLRITCFAAMLSFGGICVWMQTVSITKHTDTGLYLPGKLVQTAISILLCIPAQRLLPQGQRLQSDWKITMACVLICGVWFYWSRRSKILLAFSMRNMYNKAKSI